MALLPLWKADSTQKNPAVREVDGQLAFHSEDNLRDSWGTPAQVPSLRTWESWGDGFHFGIRKNVSTIQTVWDCGMEGEMRTLSREMFL